MNIQFFRYALKITVIQKKFDTSWIDGSINLKCSGNFANSLSQLSVIEGRGVII